MRRRLLVPPSPELREEEGALSLYRVIMPLLRRINAVSSSELSSSYLLFFTRFLFLDERSELPSVCETEPISTLD